MNILRIETIEEPFTVRETGRAASTLLGRAESMGFLSHLGTISRLNSDIVETVLQRLGREGLVQSAIMRGGVKRLLQDPTRVLHVLDEANAALENSPIPDKEWPTLRQTIGDQLLSRLCRISEVSLRRYASGTRSTPDVVAQRLHALALIVADLRGAYNDYGIRRWFQRPRAQLGGPSPEAFLSSTWDSDDAEVAELRRLAATHTSSPAT